MKRICDLARPNDPPSTRRGYARQCLPREREAILRLNVVKLTDWTLDLGLSLPEAASLLHLSSRTLRDWYGEFRIEVPRIQLLGRPTLRAGRRVHPCLPHPRDGRVQGAQGRRSGSDRLRGEFRIDAVCGLEFRRSAADRHRGCTPAALEIPL